MRSFSLIAAETADVIAVLVSDENAGEIFRRATDRREAMADLPQAEPGIHEDARFVRFPRKRNCRRNRCQESSDERARADVSQPEKIRQCFSVSRRRIRFQTTSSPRRFVLDGIGPFPHRSTVPWIRRERRFRWKGRANPASARDTRRQCCDAGASVRRIRAAPWGAAIPSTRTSGRNPCARRNRLPAGHPAGRG